MGKLPEAAVSALDALRAEFLAEQRGAAPAPTPVPAAAVAKKKKKKWVPKRAAQPGRPRTGARVAAVQALYQSEYNGESAEAVIGQFLKHRLAAEGAYEDGKVPEADARLFAELVRRTAKDGAALDAILANHLDADWPLEKLDPVLRALLRAATAELHDTREPPAKVVINEYLDIAHGFFGGDEPRFANGVLNALARALRPREFA